MPSLDNDQNLSSWLELSIEHWILKDLSDIRSYACVINCSKLHLLGVKPWWWWWYNPCRLICQYVNSLDPGRFQFHFRLVILKLTLVNGGWGISYEIALRWMPLDITDDKSTLVQVMAWCRQATSHYLTQCWPRSMSPNGVTNPQWVKDIIIRNNRDCKVTTSCIRYLSKLKRDSPAMNHLHPGIHINDSSK